VLTGCHRWELQTMRNSVWQFITVTAMLIALWLGAGLVTLAAITAIGQTLGQATMVTLAYKACPGLKLRRADVYWQTIKELYIYSGKTLLPTISDMLLNQTTSVLIIGSLGPAALAIFTRPRALLRQLDALERKMGMILVPTTSSLASIDDTSEIRKLLIKSVRYSLYLVLPIMLGLVVFGDYIMRIWMGPDYAIALLVAILAIGFIGVTIQESILAILIGLDAHGRGGVAQLVGAVISTIMAIVMVHYLHEGLIGMAIAVTVPQMIISAAYLPWMACRHLGLNLASFFHRAIVLPLLQALPFALCLAICRMELVPHPVIAALTLLAGSAMLAVFYWHYVLPGRMKGWFLRRFGKRA
jgi:O-antigen/teichoic acid export membrane protein